jgi:hypothetical protein
MVIGIPFIGNNYFLILHAICVPFIMLHWITNDNTCVLTTVEIEIRKNMNLPIDKSKCFTCRLIEPVYDFKADNIEWTFYIYTITTILWFISLYKLYTMYSKGEIQNLKDLFLANNTTKLFF